MVESCHYGVDGVRSDGNRAWLVTRFPRARGLGRFPKVFVVAAVFVGGVCALVDCGARTGLDVDVANTTSVIDADTSDVFDATTLPCIPGPVTLSRARPAVMFALDRSQSMSERLSTGTRWSVLTSALENVLPSVDQTMHIGALVFPSVGANQQTCTVPGAPDLSPAIGNVDPLLGILRAHGPSGPTPTADALDVAGAAILAYRAATTARTLVLATDGAPDCNASLDPSTCRCIQGNRCNGGTRCLDDARTIDRIRSYATRGVPTYVIGIQSGANVDFADVLDAMAIAGGRPRNDSTHRYYAASSSDELTTALVAIRNQVGACTFLTTSVPRDQGTITISVDGKTIPFDDTGKEGWEWGNRDNGEVILLGTSCPSDPSTNPNVLANVSCDVPEAGADGSDRSSDSDVSDSAADASGD